MSSVTTRPPGMATRRISARPARELGEVAYEEGEVTRRRAVAEGQGERVGDQQAHARLAAPRELGARLPEHPLGEIARDHRRGRPHPPARPARVAGAGGEVEHGARRRGDDGLRASRRHACGGRRLTVFMTS